MPQVQVCLWQNQYFMRLEAGRVIKAQGIKGEVKLACFLDDSAMLKAVKQLYIGANSYTVEHIRCDGEFCYLKLTSVSDRNAAEALVNWSVFVDKESIPLPQGRYFVEDLIGCTVSLSSGKVVGNIIDVLQYGAADVIVCCDSDGKNVMFPFLKDCVSVDIRRKTVTVEDTGFGEVAVYED